MVRTRIRLALEDYDSGELTASGVSIADGDSQRSVAEMDLAYNDISGMDNDIDDAISSVEALDDIAEYLPEIKDDIALEAITVAVEAIYSRLGMRLGNEGINVNLQFDVKKAWDAVWAAIKKFVSKVVEFFKKIFSVSRHKENTDAMKASVRSAEGKNVDPNNQDTSAKLNKMRSTLEKVITPMGSSKTDQILRIKQFEKLNDLFLVAQDTMKNKFVNDPKASVSFIRELISRLDKIADNDTEGYQAFKDNINATGKSIQSKYDITQHVINSRIFRQKNDEWLCGPWANGNNIVGTMASSELTKSMYIRHFEIIQGTVRIDQLEPLTFAEAKDLSDWWSRMKPKFDIDALENHLKRFLNNAENAVQQKVNLTKSDMGHLTKITKLYSVIIYSYLSFMSTVASIYDQLLRASTRYVNLSMGLYT